MWFVSICFVRKIIWKAIIFVYEWFVWECLAIFWFVGVEQWEGTAIFAQANSSRLGECSRTSPKSLLECSLKRTNWILSERPSRLDEMASPKQAFAKPPKPSIAILPKRESAAWARTLLSPEQGLLAWARSAARHIIFLTWLLLSVRFIGFLYLKYEACEYAWNIWGYELDWCVGMVLACKTNEMVGNESGMVLVWGMILY